MSLIWQEEEVSLLEIIRPYLSTREVVRVFEILKYDRSIEAITKRSRKLAVSFKDFGVPPLSDLSEEERKAVEEVVNSREKRLATLNPPELLTSGQKAFISKTTKTLATSILEALRDIRKQVPRLSSLSTKKANKDSKLQTLNLLLSDWHVGRKVWDEECIEIYNMEIALSRIASTPELVAQQLPVPVSTIDELVILLIGDHADGEGIFPHQAMLLEDHAAAQVNRITRATWTMIQGLRAIFPEVLTRIITTRGNHGRTESSPESNWDNIIFQQLELLVDMTQDPLLTIKNRYGGYNTYEVKGWKGLVRHKAPVQADTASAVAKFASWGDIHQYDLLAFGHFHHYGVMTWNGRPIIRNGSLMGGDDYAEELAKYDNPTQLMFGISADKKPIDWVAPLRYQQ